MLKWKVSISLELLWSPSFFQNEIMVKQFNVAKTAILMELCISKECGSMNISVNYSACDHYEHIKIASRVFEGTLRVQTKRLVM